jgi:hypothetical protein
MNAARPDAPRVHPGLTAREGRDRFLSAFGLDTAGYTAPYFLVHLGPRLVLRFRNPGLLPVHDLHHVATGYPATLLGEAQISAFELRAGCPSPLVRLLCVGAALLGLLRRPQAMALAWRAAASARSLYLTTTPYEELLSLSVSELRAFVGIPEDGCPGAAWDE